MPDVLTVPPSPLFPIGQKAAAFRAEFYPDASDADWSDWHWQMRSRLRGEEQIRRIFRLSDDELEALRRHRDSLPVAITPYYAALLDRENPDDPLRRTHLQVSAEYVRMPEEFEDPLAEDASSPVPDLVHRYPDRVLFLVTGTCATYCRYCTRSRLVGSHGKYQFGTAHWEVALDYIARHPEVRDVLLSGGDAFTLSDGQLDWLLGRLRAIPHVEFVRIGTKVPVVMPMRVTPELVEILHRHKPWISIHFTHPEELTEEVAESCGRLADAGLPLGSQTVLLRGVNDRLETMRQLMHGLLKIRVRPYYIYQCDPIVGSAHFRTSVETGLQIVQGLRGFTTGYAVPTYVVDAPGGGGKIPIHPETVVGHEGSDLLIRNYAGKIYRYPDVVHVENKT